MLKELLKNKKFLKIISKFLKEKEIIDILLVGSLIRGNKIPNDIDIFVIYSLDSKKLNDLNYDLKRKLKEIDKKFEVTGKRYEDLFSSEFPARESILSEGYSLRNKKFFSEGLGYKNLILFKYSLKNLSNSKRIQFYYSLYGRGKDKGILNKNNCYKFSDSIILSPIENSNLIKDFLERCKIEYLDFPIIIPERIVKYKLK